MYSGTGAILPDYESWFPPRRAGKGPPPSRNGHLYVSRSKFLHGGSYLAEPLVEQILRGSGTFRVICPEEHPVSDVAAMIEASETVVFSEGSAMHTLELCRGRVPKVLVVLRRRSKAWSEYYQRMMEQKCESVLLHEPRAHLTPLGWSVQREAALGQNACAVQDIAQLIEAIAAASGVPLAQPADADIRTAHALSLANLLFDPRSTRGTWGMPGPAGLLHTLQKQVLALDILPFDMTGARQSLQAEAGEEPDAATASAPREEREGREVRRMRRRQQGT